MWSIFQNICLYLVRMYNIPSRKIFPDSKANHDKRFGTRPEYPNRMQPLWRILDLTPHLIRNLISNSNLRSDFNAHPNRDANLIINLDPTLRSNLFLDPDSCSKGKARLGQEFNPKTQTLTRLNMGPTSTLYQGPNFHFGNGSQLLTWEPL